MTYCPDFDRNYWRASSVRRLLDAARDSGHELCIALGERLEDLDEADDLLADARTEIRMLRDDLDALRAVLRSYEAQADDPC